MSKKPYKSLESRNSKNGFLFVLPWTIGFALFVFVPLAYSVMFVFSRLEITTGGLKFNYVGLENLKYVLFKSPEYVNNLVDSVTGLIYKVPIILVLSLIVALVLNPKFKGRTFFRSLFFIPVIVSTGIVMNYISGDAIVESMRGAGEETSTYLTGGFIDFETVFSQMGLSDNIVTFIMGYVDNIFDLLWESGIQIILFISGLQAIQPQLYEVSKVEGATKWEEFWSVTIPMLRNSIVLVIVFTVIDFCISTNNSVMQQAYSILQRQQIYGQSASMMWTYFVTVGGLLGIILIILQKCVFDKWE